MIIYYVCIRNSIVTCDKTSSCFSSIKANVILKYIPLTTCIKEFFIHNISLKISFFHYIVKILANQKIKKKILQSNINN